ncbi:pyruvate kinase [Nomia melanderi]|uniref:pyruvate kinase n=1 Tax=Nomia melanderi TaxID=2448451 RepID=UPI003FCDD9AE
MPHFEDYTSSNDQVKSGYQTTRLEHNVQLNLNSNPKLARLTKIMVTLGEFFENSFYLEGCLNFDDNTVHVFLPSGLGVTNSHSSAVVNMMMAGANIVRLNMSHQVEKWHAITVQSIRDAGNRMYEFTGEIYPLGIAMDLQGPEIRTGIFKGDETSIKKLSLRDYRLLQLKINLYQNGYAGLKEGHAVKLVTNDLAKRAGCASCFWVSYPELPRICRPADKILIDRGAVLLQVSCVRETDVVCRVLKGGIVRDGKLVQLLDSVVALPQLSKKDEEHIELASFLECDFCIVNHTRNENMVEAVKTGFKQMGITRICVIAKLSSQQGLDSFDEILEVADGILLDRASIEIEVGPEKLFLVENFVIAKCVKIGKPVILSYHISNDLKLDLNLIANAVLNGAGAIFLKTGSLNEKETVEVIKNVDAVCRQAESARWQKEIFDELNYKMPVPLDPAHAIIVGAIETSLNLNASAIIVTTTSGRSAILLSMYRPRCPILAVTRYGAVARRLQLYYGLYPLHYKKEPLYDWNEDIEARIQNGVDSLRRRKYIKVGDAIVIVSGSREGAGFTNSIRVIYVSPGTENDVPVINSCW